MRSALPVMRSRLQHAEGGCSGAASTASRAERPVFVADRWPPAGLAALPIRAARRRA